ncbi:MAG TPA: nitroreductase family protein [Spirochaetia bacterium]|nr:nitroreductase family protein [Spirochaetia bacterium]
MSCSAMETLILARSSVRRYDPGPVPDEHILSVIEAARLAPSASNGQPWRFVVVRDDPAREELARRCFSGIFSATRFAAAAPVIIAMCAERAGLVEAAKSLKDSAMYQLDCGIAGEHLVLRAAELGLGTCWIGWFNRRGAHRALRVPFHVRIVCLIAMGYPAAGQHPRRKARKSLDEILWLNRWGVRYPGSDAAGASSK